MSTAAPISTPKINIHRGEHCVQPLRTASTLVVSDVFWFLCSILLSAQVWGAIRDDIDISFYFGLVPVLLVHVAVNAILGLYPGTGLRPVTELQRIVTGTTILHLGLTATAFLQKTAESRSRGLFVLIWIFSSVLVPLGRGVIRSRLSSRPWWGVPVVIIGATNKHRELVNTVAMDATLGFKLVGYLDDQWQHAPDFPGVRCLGPSSMCEEIAGRLRIHHAIVIATPRDANRLTYYGNVFRRIILIPELTDVPGLMVTPCDIGGTLGLELRHNLLIPVNRWVKRTMDLVVGSVAAVVALPIVALASACIRIINPGPALFTQEREGKNGRIIRIYKLRTMHVNASALLESHLKTVPAARAEWDTYCKLKDDPRVLPKIGRFLRQWSIDELPQIWNVLRGDMSLVGPRPFPTYHLDRFPEEFRKLRQQVTPGLTGLWQITARSDGNLSVQRKLDGYYIRNWSPWLDLYVLASTVRAVLSRKGAC